MSSYRILNLEFANRWTNPIKVGACSAKSEFALATWIYLANVDASVTKGAVGSYQKFRQFEKRQQFVFRKRVEIDREQKEIRRLCFYDKTYPITQ